MQEPANRHKTYTTTKTTLQTLLLQDGIILLTLYISIFSLFVNLSVYQSDLDKKRPRKTITLQNLKNEFYIKILKLFISLLFIPSKLNLSKNSPRYTNPIIPKKK